MNASKQNQHDIVPGYAGGTTSSALTLKRKERIGSDNPGIMVVVIDDIAEKICSNTKSKPLLNDSTTSALSAKADSTTSATIDASQVLRYGRLLSDAMKGGVEVLQDDRFVGFLSRLYGNRGLNAFESILKTANALEGAGKFFFIPSNEEDQIGELLYELEDVTFMSIL